MSLCDDFLEYLKSERNKSDNTLKSYDVSLRQFEDFFESLGEGHTWQTVTRDVVQEWVIYLVDNQHYNNSSVNARLSALRTFYHYLKRVGIETANPMQLISGPKKGKVLPSFVKEKEMDVLLDSEFPDTFEGILEKTVITMLYMTGMRCSEFLALEDKDVDFYSKQIKVTGKRNKQRLIPFGQELEDCIKQYMRKRNATVPEGAQKFLVNSKGKALTYFRLSGIVKANLTKVTTMQKRSPHVLRHSFATTLLNNHADIVSIQQLLGHADLSTTEVYTHLSFDDLNNAYKQAHPRGDTDSTT
ncbi:MAG: tyrosine-type recombinase/integrase [Prevotellaceae bacterium]|nr:tyrosine-type recombinase/integrase [Candidatus Colivivens equi]MCQ2077952.1 tyrosine-type recombinase/integrase [Bacteroidaceae bacterium]